MTIYAIVNNLLKEGLQDSSDEPVWTVMSPSSILQGGNPYFVPDFDTRFEAHPAMALRIGKLGKGIAARFAYRYVESVAPAAIMTASNILMRLREAGRPWAQAISYDRSLALGKFTGLKFEEIPQSKAKLEMFHPGESEPQINESGETLFPIGEIISSISRDNALKTGDIILTNISTGGTCLQPGQHAILLLNNGNALKFNIR